VCSIESDIQLHNANGANCDRTLACSVLLLHLSRVRVILALCLLIVDVIGRTALARAQDVSCKAIGEHNLARCAVSASLTLDRERAGIRAAEARVESARPWLPSNPMFSAGLGFRNATVNEKAATNWNLGVSQEFELGGQSWLRTSAAEQDLSAQKLRTTATEREAAYAAWGAYFEVLAAQKDLLLAARLQQASTVLAASMQARADKGFVSKVDADVADVVQLKYAQTRIGAEARLRVALATLTTLLGFDALVTSVEVGGELAPVPLAATRARALLFAHAKLAEQQPALKALRLEGEASLLRAESLRRSRLPKLTLSLSLQNDGLLDQKTYGVGVGLPLPLLQPVGRASKSNWETIPKPPFARRPPCACGPC
jgi:outer membrane protein TolC